MGRPELESFESYEEAQRVLEERVFGELEETLGEELFTTLLVSQAKFIPNNLGHPVKESAIKRTQENIVCGLDDGIPDSVLLTLVDLGVTLRRLQGEFDPHLALEEITWDDVVPILIESGLIEGVE